MPRVTIRVGGPEPIGATISKATPMGALGTDAIVHVGQLIITGQAAALRALADALTEAATWPTPTTPTPTPGTNVSGRSVTPTVDRPVAAASNQPRPPNRDAGRAAAATASTRPDTRKRGP